MERNYRAPTSIVVDPDELNWRTAFSGISIYQQS
jgi:hypothetical protein